jgi:hypothetical protein
MFLFSAAYICGQLFERFTTSSYMIPLNASNKMFRSYSTLLFFLQVANLSPNRASNEAETEAKAQAEAIFVFF